MQVFLERVQALSNQELILGPRRVRKDIVGLYHGGDIARDESVSRLAWIPRRRRKDKHGCYCGLQFVGLTRCMALDSVTSITAIR